LKRKSSFFDSALGSVMPLFHHPKHFDSAAFEVGHITFGWATLESAIGDLNSHLMGLEGRSANADILNGNMDIRAKIGTAKGLAFLYHFDKDWLHTTLTLLDHVDNYLRPRRNEITHSQWFLPRGRILRVTQKTKIVRPQSFSLALETKQETPVRLTDLRQLRHDIQETWTAFLPVIFYTMDGDRLLDPSSSPTISWQRYLRVAGLGNPLRNVIAVRKRLRRASLASKKS